MARANRLTTDGGVFHVTHRCHNRTFLLKFARDRDAYPRHRFCPAETPRLLKRTRTFGFYRRAQFLTGKKRAKKNGAKALY
jgi:hypothetical protein